MKDFFLKLKRKIVGKLGERPKMMGVWSFQEVDETTGEITREWKEENLIPDVALEAFAAQLGNNATYNVGDSLYIALGTSSTTPVNGDTTLTNETLRKAVTSDDHSGAVAEISVFFTSSEVSGTYEEVGLFGDGYATQATASADTGILYSRSTQTVTVGAGKALTVFYSITFAR